MNAPATRWVPNTAALDALRVLYANRNRFVKFSTAAIAGQTGRSPQMIGKVLGQAATAGMVERARDATDPRQTYWRLLVTGCEFMRGIDKQ